jgi:hypothetical protein
MTTDQMVRNTGRYFPALRITENGMTEEEILHTFNYSFVAVERVEKKGKSYIIHFDPENEQDLGSWDSFYEHLDEHGQLYVDKTPRDSDEFHGYGILYSKEPLPNGWEVHYARKTSPRMSTTSTNPRVKPREKQREKARAKAKTSEAAVPIAIKCTCVCNCGARLGISI